MAQDRQDRDVWWRAIRLAISNAGGAPGSANLRLLHSATHSSQHWSNRASGRERAAACLAQPFHTHTQTHSRARAHTHTHTLSLSCLRCLSLSLTTLSLSLSLSLCHTHTHTTFARHNRRVCSDPRSRLNQPRPPSSQRARPRAITNPPRRPATTRRGMGRNATKPRTRSARGGEYARGAAGGGKSDAW